MISQEARMLSLQYEPFVECLQHYLLQMKVDRTVCYSV
jgi:hypothetical protein